MKRILTVQDISCVGKCSLTAALPVLSAMGLETAVLPTAVLSTHTQFTGFTFRDLTDDIPAVAEHWRKEDFRFSAFYSGYLGSIRQVRMVRELFSERKRQGDLVLVDPVMADYGRFYTGFGPEFAEEMLKLCAEADVVVPNITEACLLLNRPYREDFSPEEKKELAEALIERGCGKVVLTGVETVGEDGKKRIGALCCDGTGAFSLPMTEKLPAMFHGTGDLFASVLLGGLCGGMALEQAASLAVDYIAECIRVTLENPDHADYGVEFEQVFPWLLRRLGK